jgi:predicted dehydrogenase
VGVLGGRSWIFQQAVGPALAASAGCRVAAVAAASGPVVQPWGGEVVAGYQAVIDHPEVEAVYLPLPNGLHRRWTEAAARAGKHVLCEKPLAGTSAEAMAMVAVCREADVVLAEAYMTPFHPRSAALGGLIASGSLGRPVAGRAAFTFPIPPERSADYRWDPTQGGGALLDVGIYCLSPLLAFAGDPVELLAAATLTASGVDASFSAMLRSGPECLVTATCSFDAPEQQLLELVGSEGRVTIVERPFTPGLSDDRLMIHRRDGSVEEHHTGGGNPYLGMVEAFAAAVRGEAPWPRSAMEGVRLLELMEHLRRSVRA